MAGGRHREMVKLEVEINIEKQLRIFKMSGSICSLGEGKGNGCGGRPALELGGRPPWSRYYDT